MNIDVTTGREAVLEVCRTILAEGRSVAPRGQETLEVSPMTIRITDSADTLPTHINRARLTPAIAVAEALQNIAGIAAPGLMHSISKFFPKPTSRWDEGVPTYGVRMAERYQLYHVIETLTNDPASREAVAVIWRAGDMNDGQAHNLCTLSLQFLIRNGALDMHVTMRSNDAWYGLCYDLFQFAQVQWTIANCLGIDAGDYYHTTASMHLYKRHWDAAEALTPGYGRAEDWHFGIGGAGLPRRWSHAALRAQEILEGRGVDHPTQTELWYMETLAPYRDKEED